MTPTTAVTALLLVLAMLLCVTRGKEIVTIEKPVEVVKYVEVPQSHEEPDYVIEEEPMTVKQTIDTSLPTYQQLGINPVFNATTS